MKKQISILLTSVLLLNQFPIVTAMPQTQMRKAEDSLTQDKEIEDINADVKKTSLENKLVNKNNDVERSSSVPNEEKLDSSITNLSTHNDKETTAKQLETRDVVSRSAGDIWTSPKYESDVERALIDKSKKELGNIVREGLKKVTNTEVGYLKGDSVDIDIGKAYTTYSAKAATVVTHKEFPTPIIPTNEALSIGAGYSDTSVSIPIGTEGLSSDGSLKFKVISSQKIRVERVKNKHTSSTVKLPMYVPLTSDTMFFYQSAKESIFTGHAQQFPIFVNLQYHNYYHSLNNKVNLYYDRLEENWQVNKGDINILDHITLEDSPEVQAAPKKSSFDMPTKVPSTPEEYVTTSNTMTGGTLTYTWIDQLDVNAKNDQSIRVKVVDQLDDYKHEATTTLKFKANPDKTSVVVKDSTLYQGQTYHPENDNFVSATDIDGNPLKWDDPNLKLSGDIVDMKVPKTYNQILTYTYVFNGETKTKTVNYKVTVKADQTKLELEDVLLYVGEKWDPNLPFKNVIDKDGNKLDAENIESYHIQRNGNNVDTIDTSTTGIYEVKISHPDALGNLKESNVATVQVKRDYTSLELKDVEIYVGENWTAKDNFVTAVDEENRRIPWESGRIDANGAKVDTSKPNEYTFKYTLKGRVKTVEATTKVTVKAHDLSLITPEEFSFGTAVLGQSTELYWDKKSEVLVNDDGNRAWDLTTKLTESDNQDFGDFLKFKGQSFNGESVLIASGTSSKNITEDLTENNFIYVDYSFSKSVRQDKATLEWTLSPSIQQIKE